MNLETIGAIAGLISPAVIVLWIWYTEKYRPERQKQAEISSTRSFARQEGARDFNEASQNTSLEQILSTQEQLIRHIIESNNGHLSKLTSEVIRGDKELSGKLEKVIASLNFLIVLMSRNRATMPSVEGVEDWGDVSKVMEAIISSEEEQNVSDLSADATAAGERELSRDE